MAKKCGTKKKAVKKPKYICESCGLVISVDEACGCVQTCDIICCGQPMKEKK